MKLLTEYFNVASIHGLHYITSSRKLNRLFWIAVVLSGLVGSFVLIHESFDSWAKSPIKTTVVSKPIKELRFPKLTVCPPKHTFTDLNYDLVSTKNMKLDQETKADLTEFAMGAIQDHMHEELMSRLNQLQEENRYFNWYLGLTYITLPIYEKTGKLYYEVWTWATSGAIKTIKFGEKNDWSFEKNVLYNYNIHYPQEAGENENVTLNFDVEFTWTPGLENGNKDKDTLKVADNVVTDKNKFLHLNPPNKKTFFCSIQNSCGRNFKLIQVNRFLSEEFLKNLELDLMPGSKVSWYYSGEKVKQVYAFENNALTINFKR